MAAQLGRAVANGSFRRAQRAKFPAGTLDVTFALNASVICKNSVWITLDPLNEERKILGGGRIDVESLLLLAGRPCAGESDAQIVAGAWDFDAINRRYTTYLKVLGGASQTCAAERVRRESAVALGGGNATHGSTP